MLTFLLSSLALGQGTISGMVGVEGGDQPIVGAHVMAFMADSNQPAADAVTDPSGAYVMEVPFGHYFVVAGAEGFLPEWFDNVPHRNEATMVPVFEGHNAENINFSLIGGDPPPPPPGTISGNVTDEATGDPIPGALVHAFFVNSDRPAAHIQADPEGNYVLHVPYGDFHVQAGMEGYAPEWYDNVPHRSEATIVTVTEDGNADGIDFSLAEPPPPPDGAISGRILEEGTDNGIGMAHVTAVRLGDEPFSRSTMSNNMGEYNLPHLPPGPYVVHAEKWGWAPGVYPETLMVENTAIEGIDIFLSHVNNDLGSISGMITDGSTGDPIVHAYIVAIGNNPMHTRFGYSGEDGSYTVDGLRADTYHVAAHKEGYVPGSYPDPVEVDGNEVDGIDIALNAVVPSGIMGMVTDAETGDPIGGAHVNAVNVENHHIHHDVRTGEDGVYILMVPPGEYRVQAGAQEYLPQEYPEHVMVVEGEFAQNIDFALEAIQFGSIAGTVTDTDGNGIANAMVEARSLNGFFRRQVRTDADGAYMFEHVIPAGYIVRAHKFGFNPGVYPDTVVVDNGEAVTGIDIVLEPYVPPFDGYISGTVTDDDTGEPIANAIVFALGLGGEPNHRHWFHRRAFTGEDGTYTLEYLPETEFKVFAASHDYIGEFYDNVTNFHDATPVTPNADGIDFGLAPRGGLRNLSGTIFIAGMDDPLESIVYASVNGEIVDIALSDIDGFYSFNGINADEYDISVFSVYGEGDLGYPVDLTLSDMEGADIFLSPTGVEEGAQLLPTTTMLNQNYPNPFNAQTMISFNLSAPADVELAVYNIIGQKVATLISGQRDAGSYDVVWNGMDRNGQPAASGIYYYKLSAGDYTETMRMTLLK